MVVIVVDVLVVWRQSGIVAVRACEDGFAQPLQVPKRPLSLGSLLADGAAPCAACVWCDCLRVSAKDVYITHRGKMTQVDVESAD